VCYGELICIPEWAGDPVEGADDDGVELGRLRRAAARGKGKSGGGKVGTGLDQVEELGKEVEEQLARQI
jgi:hypothetical protein